MSIFKKIKEKRCLKKIEPLVEKELIEMGLLKIENGEKIYKMGSVNIRWQIQKRLMKELYNIDWKSPHDKKPHINYD